MGGQPHRHADSRLARTPQQCREAAAYQPRGAPHQVSDLDLTLTYDIDLFLVAAWVGRWESAGTW